MTRSKTVARLVALIGAAVLLAAGCGGDASTQVVLEGPAAEGLDVAKNSGCASCHGQGFKGGTGPSWVGLFGSTVGLSDGSTVVADRAYLFESIRDPSAKGVDGYPLLMPTNSLGDDQINAIVDYIESLADR